jgi:hypothetical protein
MTIATSTTLVTKAIVCRQIIANSLVIPAHISRPSTWSVIANAATTEASAWRPQTVARNSP